MDTPPPLRAPCTFTNSLAHSHCPPRPPLPSFPCLRGLDIYKVNDLLSQAGWHLNALQRPAALHICLTAAHSQGIVQLLLRDLKEAVQTVLQVGGWVVISDSITPGGGRQPSTPVAPGCIVQLLKLTVRLHVLPLSYPHVLSLYAMVQLCAPQPLPGSVQFIASLYRFASPRVPPSYTTRRTLRARVMARAWRHCTAWLPPCPTGALCLSSWWRTRTRCWRQCEAMSQ